MDTQEKKPKKIKICPICKEEFTGKGYSTYPLGDNPRNKCCKDCHANVILPLVESLVTTLDELGNDFG